MDYSMTKARGGMMLLENATGVRLPRALNSLIASIPAVGAAFSAMLPIIGVAAAIAVVYKLVEANKKAQEALAQHTIAWKALGAETEEQTDSLRATNVELKQELSVLNGGIKNNLAVELAKAAVDADKLAKSLGEDVDKMMKLLETQKVGFWGHLFGNEGSEDIQEALQKKIDDVKTTIENGKEDIRKASQTGDKSQVKTAETKAATADQKAYGEVIRWVGDQYTEAAKKRTALTDRTVSTDDLGNAQIEKAADSQAYDTLTKKMKTLSGVSRELRDESDMVALSLANQTASMNIAGAKDKKEKNPGDSSALEDARKLADQKYTIAMESAKQLLEQNKITIDQEVALEHAAMADKLAADTAYFEGKKNLFGTTKAQLATLTTDETLATRAAAAEDAKIDAEAAKHKMVLAKEVISKTLEGENRLSQNKLKLYQETAKYEEQSGKLALASGEQSLNSAVAHETMSWSQAHQKKLALIAQETAAKITAIKKQGDAEDKELSGQIERQRAAIAATLSVNGNNDKDKEVIALKEKLLALLQQQKMLEAQTGNAAKLAGQEGAAATKKEQDALTPLQEAMKKTQNQFNQDFAKMAVEGKSFGQSMRQLTIQMLEQWIAYEMKSLERTAMTSIMKTTVKTTEKATDVATTATAEAAKASIEEAANAKSRLSDAKKGAVKAYNAFADIPVVGPVLGAAAAVGAFGFLMAFQNGGTVPGTGSGDTVPAMLSPGETVVSKALTDQVKNNTGSNSRGDTHNHLTYAPNVTAIDATGVEKMLKKHANVFQKHVTSTLRKQNKRGN
jgi:hypothetical protein